MPRPSRSGGIGQREFRRFARALERGLLRGPRLAGGLDGIIAALRAVEPAGRWEAPVPAPDLLACEQLASRGFFAEIPGADRLDRDQSVELGIAPEEDEPHRARPEQPVDRVATDLARDARVHVSS